MKNLVFVAGLALWILVASRELAAETYVWSGASGVWSDSALWVPSTGVPGEDDTAVVTGGTVEVLAGVTVGTLELGGGRLSGVGTLTVASSLDWSGGGSFHSAPGASLLVPTHAELSDVTFTGGGEQRFTGGNLVLGGVCRSESVTLAGVTLAGTHSLSGDWNWEGGA